LTSFPENSEVSAEALESPVVDLMADPVTHTVAAIPRHPPWWDVFVLVVLTLLTVVFLFVSMAAAVIIAKEWIYPHVGIAEIVRMPLVAVFGEVAGYLLLLPCMYVLVTRVQNRSDFFAAIHWNWPANIGRYIFLGFALSLTLQGVAHLLPIPKNLPIDSFFRTPEEAWVLSIFGITLAPLMEELYFRGFLYPLLERYIGMAAAFVLRRPMEIADTIPLKRYISTSAAIVLTAAPFALLHGAQLKFAWGPVLVIFLVGAAFGTVRAVTDSVAAGLLVHVAYNATISILMFVATDGFRHLERLNQ